MSALSIECIETTAMPAGVALEMQRLCDAAFAEHSDAYFQDIGPGIHLLGRRDGVMVSHLMWVTRWLQPEGQPPLRTAYIEQVATASEHEGKGYATALLEHMVPHIQDFELAALCPATEGLYARLGWHFWRGPLSTRKDGALIPTPEERVMILPLARSPALDLDAPISVEWREGDVW